MTRWGTVLCLALVAGCGRGTPGAAPSTAPPKPTISRAKARALVTAGTLRPGDLPGYHAERGTGTDVSPSPGAIDFGRELDRCVGGAGQSAAFVDGPGVAFTKGDLEIDSQVSVARTVPAAVADTAAFVSPKTAECLEKVFTSAFAYQKIVLTHFSARQAHPVIRGSDQTIGLRIRFTITKDRSVVLRLVMLGSRVGQAEVSLVATAVGTALPSDATLTALLTRATKRVRAAA
jgi:hypothetical protein